MVNLLNNPAWAAAIEEDPTVSDSRVRGGPPVRAVYTYAQTADRLTTANAFGIQPTDVDACVGFWNAYLADVVYDAGDVPPVNANLPPEDLGVPDASANS